VGVCVGVCLGGGWLWGFCDGGVWVVLGCWWVGGVWPLSRARSIPRGKIQIAIRGTVFHHGGCSAVRRPRIGIMEQSPLSSVKSGRGKLGIASAPERDEGGGAQTNSCCSFSRTNRRALVLPSAVLLGTQCRLLLIASESAKVVPPVFQFKFFSSLGPSSF